MQEPVPSSSHAPPPPGIGHRCSILETIIYRDSLDRETKKLLLDRALQLGMWKAGGEEGEHRGRQDGGAGSSVMKAINRKDSSKMENIYFKKSQVG